MWCVLGMLGVCRTERPSPKLRWLSVVLCETGRGGTCGGPPPPPPPPPSPLPRPPPTPSARLTLQPMLVPTVSSWERRWLRDGPCHPPVAERPALRVALSAGEASALPSHVACATDGCV